MNGNVSTRKLKVSVTIDSGLFFYFKRKARLNGTSLSHEVNKALVSWRKK